MAQIRKFDGGGTFSFNGKTYNYDEYAKFFEEQATHGNQNAAIIVSAKAKDPNKHISISSRDNTFQLNGVDESVFLDNGMSQGTYNSVDNKNSFLRQLVRRRSGNDWIRDGLELGMAFQNNVITPKTKPEEEEVKYKYTFGGGRKAFRYDDKGNLIDDPDNYAIWDDADLLEQYYLATPEERKEYDISALDADQLNAYVKWRDAKQKELGDKYDETFGLNKWKAASKTKGGLGADFYNIYDFLNYRTHDSEQAAEVDALEEAKIKAEALRNQTLTNAGYDPEVFKDYLTLDDKGNIVFTDKAKTDLLKLINQYQTNNIIFNDDFHAYNPGNEWLNGYVLMNGKLYKQSDADKDGTALFREIHKPGGFYDLNKKGDWDASDKIFKWNFSGSKEIMGHETPYVGLSDFTNRFDLTDYSTNNTYYTDENDVRRNIRDMGWKVIRYIAKNASTNSWGHRIENYAIVDRYGRPIQVNLTKDDFKNELWTPNDDERNDHLFTPLTYAFDQSNDNWKGWFEDAELSANKSNGENAFKVYTYFDENGQQKYRLVMSDPLFRAKNMKDYAYDNVPLEVIQALAIAMNKSDKNDDLIMLSNAIKDLTNTGWSDMFTRSALDKSDKKIKEIFERLGLNQAQLDAFVKYFGGDRQSHSTGNRWERRDKYAVAVPIHRSGGTLKLQAGGYNAGINEEANKPQIVGSKDDANYFGDSAKIRSEQLSNADWAELTSVGLDVIGTAVSFVPGWGDVGGLGLGVASSVTQLGADLSRPGNAGQDWTNFAKNLGLDVVTAIPFLGDSAGVASTVKKLGKVSKYLSPIFIGAGFYQASDALTKASRGEELTVDDWAHLASGFQALMGIGAAGKRRWDQSKVAALTSKKLAGKSPKYKYTIPGTDKTVELTSSEVESLISKKPKDANVELNTIVKNRLNGVEGIEIPQVKLEDFGLTQKGHLRWKSVEGKPVEDERSALSFFLTGRPGKYLDEHASAVKEILPDLAKTRTTTKKVGPSIETTTESYYPSNGMTRTAARVFHRNGIDVPTELYGYGFNTRRRLAPVRVDTKYSADIDGIRSGAPLMLGYTPQVNPVRPVKVQPITPSVINLGSPSSVRTSRINIPSSITTKYLGNPTGSIKRYTPDGKVDTRIARLGWNAVSPKEVVAKLSRSKDAKEFWALYNSLSPTRQRAVRNYIEKSSSKNYKQMFDKFFDKKNIKAEISKIQTAEDFHKFVKDAQNRPELINFLLKNPKFFQQYMKAAMNRAGLKGSKVKSYRDYFRELGVTLFQGGGKMGLHSFNINTDENGMSVASWLDENDELHTQIVDAEGYAIDENGKRIGDKTLRDTLFEEIDAAVVVADIPGNRDDVREVIPEPLGSDIAAVSVPVNPLNVNPTKINNVAISSIPIKTNSIEDKQMKFKDDPFRFVKRRAAIIRGAKENVEQPTYAIALKNGGTIKAAGGTVLPWGQIGQVAGAIIPEAAKIGMAVNASNQQWQDAKKMRKELSKFGPQGVTETYDNFSDYGVANAHRIYANSLLNNKAASNDYGQNYAINQTGLSAYNTAGLENNLKLSEMVSNHAGEQNALKRNYNIQNNQTLNAWKQYQGNLLAAEYQYKGAHRAQVNQALQGGIKNMQDILGGIRTQRNTASNTLFNMDQSIAAAAKNGQDVTAMQQQRDHYAQQYNLNAKKGGKLSKQRPAADQIWINKERDVQKAVSKLNDNAVKFILKALS